MFENNNQQKVAITKLGEKNFVINNTTIKNQIMRKITRNAMRCNNHDDLLHLGFTLKISIFSEDYI